jgi:hypothetical protein
MDTTEKRKCIHIAGCDADAVRVVNSQRMCEPHAVQEETETAAWRVRMTEWANTPEARAEAAAEQAWEARVS